MLHHTLHYRNMMIPAATVVDQLLDAVLLFLVLGPLGMSFFCLRFRRGRGRFIGTYITSASIASGAEHALHIIHRPERFRKIGYKLMKDISNTYNINMQN